MSKCKPLYCCRDCYDEYSYHAEDLRVYEDELWCENCWDDYSCWEEEISKLKAFPPWSELTVFVPEHVTRIAELEGALEKATVALRIKSEFLKTRQCPDHSGKWKRGRCLQCEIERAEAALHEIGELQEWAIVKDSRGFVSARIPSAYRGDWVIGGHWIEADELHAILDKYKESGDD